MKSLNIPYNPRIDSLRWLAATIVFLYHFYYEYHAVGGVDIVSNWFGIVTEGHTGVGLFFTLSGFLFMQIAIHQKNIIYRDFIRNRCLRICPLFFTIFLISISIGKETFQAQDIFYLFATNLGNSPTSNSVITGAAWCISLEFLFYMLFPFLSRFVMTYGARYLLKLLLLMMFFKLAAYTVTDHSKIMYYSTFVGRFDQFLIGMLAALLYFRHGALVRRYATVFLAIAGLLVIMNSAALARLAPFGDQNLKPAFWVVWLMLESTGWSLFILAWVAFDKALPKYLESMICYGGKISFSFYLIHAAVIHMFMQWIGLVSITHFVWINIFIALTANYLTTWLLASLSYSAIEEPFLRMRHSYGPAVNI